MLLRPRRGEAEPRRARRRTASPVSASRVHGLPLRFLPETARRFQQARGSTTGPCLPALRRVWPLPAARNGPGPGERRPGSQPSSTGENDSLRVWKTERRGSSASARPELLGLADVVGGCGVFRVRAARTLPPSRTGPPLSSRRTCAARQSAATRLPDLEIGERLGTLPSLP